MLFRFVDKQVGYDFTLDILFPSGVTRIGIQEMLSEYRKSDDNYNNIGWIKFLVNKGYQVKEAKIPILEF